jgi:hypothetical protein
MGFILNETITLPNGLTVTNPYLSIGENDMRVWKRTSGNETVTTKYIINGRFTMWMSQEIRDMNEGVVFIDTINVEVVTETPPIGNIYELLYDKLKTERECTDVI